MVNATAKTLHSVTIGSKVRKIITPDTEVTLLSRCEV